MSIYLDASAIVPLILRDAHTMNMEQWLANAREDLVVSDFAALEVAAVISRQVRLAHMSEQKASLALTLLDDWMTRVSTNIETDASDIALADRFVRDFATKLAAPDALHLALASNRGYRLATFDTRLAAAAAMRGVRAVALE
ncbi:MAG: type II toxin-antitoxin system VapC family toxin [Methylocystis sp.]|jgi:predicted nucleic acid-binding protein